MNKKERIEAAMRHKDVDRIPWTIYKGVASWGEAEFKLRVEGMTPIYLGFPITIVNLPNVELVETQTYYNGSNGKSGRNTITRKFKTSLGEVSSKYEFLNKGNPIPGDWILRYGSGIEQEALSWWAEHPFKSESDYKILEHIYNSIEYIDNSEDFLYTEKIIGNEGYVMANVGKSPFQAMISELMGLETCYFELHSNPKKFRSLYEVLCAKTKEKYEMAANSPADVIWAPENLTSLVTPPPIFKEFCIPFYNEVADILHKKGKLLATHMDGNLKGLKELINETKIDIIEAFTPSPMCDMSVEEARKAWPDKVIWINFPQTLLATYTIEMIEEYTTKILNSIAPAKGFMIGNTENFPLDTWGRVYQGIGNAIDKFRN